MKIVSGRAEFAMMLAELFGGYRRRIRKAHRPHQGKRECARRLKQMKLGQLGGCGVSTPAARTGGFGAEPRPAGEI